MIGIITVDDILEVTLPRTGGREAAQPPDSHRGSHVSDAPQDRVRTAGSRGQVPGSRARAAYGSTLPGSGFTTGGSASLSANPIAARRRGPRRLDPNHRRRPHRRACRPAGDDAGPAECRTR